MKLDKLRILASKVAKGYARGDITGSGMSLSNGEKLLLFRERKKELEGSVYRNMSIFLYICRLVWQRYYDECRKIITSKSSIKTLNGEIIYPELAKINEDIALCLCVYSLHSAGKNFNKFSEIEVAYKIYSATRELVDVMKKRGT